MSGSCVSRLPKYGAGSSHCWSPRSKSTWCRLLLWQRARFSAGPIPTGTSVRPSPEFSWVPQDNHQDRISVAPRPSYSNCSNLRFASNLTHHHLHTLTYKQGCNIRYKRNITAHPPHPASFQMIYAK